MAESFTEIQLPQQKLFSSNPLPTVLSPANPTTLDRLTQSVKAQTPHLKSLLHRSGAVLFRGFPINSASDFNDFVEAFGFDELPYIGGAAPRTNVVGRVFTANESPPDQEIHFHHEMAQVRFLIAILAPITYCLRLIRQLSKIQTLQVPEFPTKIFFFCEVEPGSEGETPIVLSHIVYERMKEKYPDFVQELEEHGLIYTRILGEGDDPSSPIGRGWKSTFLTDDKNVAEKRLSYAISTTVNC